MSETIVALLTLGVLILFHELGHFIAGKRLGVYIHEFSIGFGPSSCPGIQGKRSFQSG